MRCLNNIKFEANKVKQFFLNCVKVVYNCGIFEMRSNDGNVKTFKGESIVKRRKIMFS